jgi:hypothetical protein
MVVNMKPARALDIKIPQRRIWTISNVSPGSVAGLVNEQLAATTGR